MSLYGMIFGRNPLAGSLLAMLNLTEGEVGRLRDVFLRKGEDDQPEIHVYTRNGGGNREEYQHVFDDLAEHPLYLGNADDSFDCTYATIRFKAPESMRAWLAELMKDEDQRPPTQRWMEFLDKMQTKPDDPDVKRVLTSMAPLMEQIKKAVSS